MSYQNNEKLLPNARKLRREMNVEFEAVCRLIDETVKKEFADS